MKSETARRSGHGWILRLIIAALVWLSLGVTVSFWLGMGWIDRVAFLACLGVVFVIGATGFMAWRDAGSDEDGP